MERVTRAKDKGAARTLIFKPASSRSDLDYRQAGRSDEKVLQNLGAPALDERVESRGVVCGLGVHEVGPSTRRAREVDQAGGRPDGAGGPDGQEDERRAVRAPNECVDRVEMGGVEHLPEPHDVRTQERARSPRLT